MKLLLVLGAEDTRISEDEREWLEMILDREKPDRLAVEVSQDWRAADSSPFVSSVRSLATDRGWPLAALRRPRPGVVAILPSLGPCTAGREDFWQSRGVDVLKPNWQSDYARSGQKKKK